MITTLQREHWNGKLILLGDLFRVSKMRGDKRLEAACRLWTHQLGWVCAWRSTAICSDPRCSARRTTC
jgi:hypothetical protein